MEARATRSYSGGFEGDRRQLVEAAGRKNGRGDCMEARATGSCSRGFEGGRRQSRRRNKAGRRPLVEAAGRRNGREDCTEALPVGAAGDGAEGKAPHPRWSQAPPCRGWS